MKDVCDEKVKVESGYSSRSIKSTNLKFMPRKLTKKVFNLIAIAGLLQQLFQPAFSTENNHPDISKPIFQPDISH